MFSLAAIVFRFSVYSVYLGGSKMYDSYMASLVVIAFRISVYIVYRVKC